MASNSKSNTSDSVLPPLYERIPRKNTIPRAVELTILFLLSSLLAYRLFHLKDHGFSWLLAFLCEACFNFNWFLLVSIKWNQVDFKTHPERLLQQVSELPAVDVFVTTADDVMEPPVITVNTVLSLLALDYPANKLACYVSDDGCSPLTFFSLLEASKFAKFWVPFCKKYNIPVRAPFRYFSSSAPKDCSPEFQEDWENMKEMYEQLCHRIESAAQGTKPCDFTGEFAVFSNTERKNHPTILQLLLENKEALPNGLPHLIYVSREKRPKHPHHFKAGAMNVLTRVSGVMTNAPFMLNVDCDMFVNNAKVVHHAMCLLAAAVGAQHRTDVYAYAQFPQAFYGKLKDDPFGNQLNVLFQFVSHGIAGSQGPLYAGTGCFHRRKVIYGLSPEDQPINVGKLSEVDLKKKYGKSMEFAKTAAEALSDWSPERDANEVGLASSIEAALQVAGCGYESDTIWGKEVGWIYGSATEDVLTGGNIQARGWKSASCRPNPPAFLGCAPSGGPEAMTQQKRWATGLMEILLSRKGPLGLATQGKLQFRQTMAYLWLYLWAPRSIPEIVYSLLPAYCLITNTHFLPKFNEPAMLIPVSIFIIYNIYSLSEYIRIGATVREWWNNQRMDRVKATSAWLFGFLIVVLKLLGLVETSFEVTAKDQKGGGEEDRDANAGRFTFSESPIFVPGTTILLVNLAALSARFLGLRPFAGGESEEGSGAGEVICSVCVVMCFWAFLKGLFGKGKYGIPSSIIFKSGLLALLFLHFCKWTI